MSTETNNNSSRQDFWALLVGIDDYRAVAKLRGCVNDIKAMRDFLIRNLKVPEAHILTLTTDNPEALPTRDRILKAFQEFLIHNPEIKHGDQILFHYSGHGSQIKDTTGVEPDGYNETLVAQDSRTGDIWDIPDKTIAALLDQLIARKGENITVILDCCHSGSGTREIPDEGAALVRKLAPDERRPPSDLDADILATAPRRNAGPSGWATQDIPYTLLAACLDKEEASEHPAQTPGAQAYFWHGALTYFTLEALRQMAPNTSYAQLYERVSVKVNSQYPSQMPQCEGKRDREVFGHSQIYRDPFVLVKHLKGKISLDAGLIHQLQPGTRLELYPDSVLTRDHLPEPLATVEVESVLPTTAQAKVVKANQEIPEVTRGLITEVVYTGVTQTVALHAAEKGENGEPLPEATVQENRTTIQGLKQFLTDNPSPYLTLAENPEQAAQLRVEAANGKLNIQDAKGKLLVLPEDITGGVFASTVANALDRIARFRAIMELTNQEPGSQLVGQIEVKLRHGQGAEAKELGPEFFSEGGELILPYDPDDEKNNYYVIDVINRSQLEVYPYIFVFSPDYSITTIFPLTGQQNAIAPGRTLSIGPDRGQRHLQIYLPEGWNSSRDYLKTIVTTAPADFTLLEQKGLNVPPTRSSGIRSVKSPLDQLINTAVSGANTRFARPAQTLAGEDWTTLAFPFTVNRLFQTTPLTAATDTVSLPEGLTLEKPAGFKGTVTVTTWDQAKRSVDGDPSLAPPPGLTHHPEFQPLTRTQTRGLGAGNLLLAFEVDESSRSLITPATPLRLNLPAKTAKTVDELLPVVFDGEDYLPVGYGLKGAKAVEIVELPDPKTPARRGMGRTVRLFVYTKMGRYTKSLGLRYARRNQGGYEYGPISRDQFKPGDKVALLVHGFNSDTGWMLKTVAPFLYEEVLPYDHILTWDYETLGTTVTRSGEDLALTLKQQAGFGADDDLTLHVYAHSMGSIISRCMIELAGGHEFVDRLVIAGPPNRGTTLATTGRGAVYLLTLLLNEYSVVPPVGALNWGLKQLYEQTLGPADLGVDSEVLRRLNALEKPANVPYLILAGNNTVDEAKYNRLNRLAQKVLDKSLDTLFGEDHDLVIGLSSLQGLRGGAYPKVEIASLTCNHFDYYDLPEARQIIKTWINSDL